MNIHQTPNMRTLKIIGAVLFLSLLTLFIGSLSIDQIVKSEIEDSSSKLFNTAVTIDEVDLSLLDGSGTISGIRVANPDKFSSKPAINIHEVNIRIGLRSLFSDTILIKKVMLTRPQFYFEQRGLEVNLKILSDNMNLAESDSDSKNVIIDYLLIRNGQVEVSSDLDRQNTAKATIEEFELKEMGRDKSNTVQQSIYEIMDPLLDRAIAAAVRSGLTEQFKNKVNDVLN